MEKVLGKIQSAEYGMVEDYPFLVGLQLWFTFSDGGVGDGGKYTVNISEECKWESKNRAETITASVEKTAEILKSAKVHYVSELIGKPVEVTLDGNLFEDFRILTEVL